MHHKLLFILLVLITSCSNSNNDHLHNEDEIDSVVRPNSGHAVKEIDLYKNGELFQSKKYDLRGNLIWIGFLNENGEYIKYVSTTYDENNSKLKDVIQSFDYTSKTEIAMHTTFAEKDKVVLKHFRKTDLDKKLHVFKINVEFNEDGTMREIFLYDTPTGSQRQYYEDGRLVEIIHYGFGTFCR